MIVGVGCAGARVVDAAAVVVGSSVSTTGVVVSTVMVVIPSGISVVHLILALGVIMFVSSMDGTPFNRPRPAVGRPAVGVPF